MIVINGFGEIKFSIWLNFVKGSNAIDRIIIEVYYYNENNNKTLLWINNKFDILCKIEYNGYNILLFT